MNVRILHIEDSPDDAWLLQRVLRKDGWSVEATVITSLPELKRQVDRSWDVVLCDFGLPGFSTIEALSLVREHQPDVPFVVVSGQIGEENAVALMKAGVDDYVSKNYIQRLSPILRRLMESRQIKEEQRAERQRHEELENRFRQFFYGNLSGMAMLSPSGEIQEINQALRDLLGLNSDPLPSFWSLFVSPEQARVVRTRLATRGAFGPEVVEMVRSDTAHNFLLSTFQFPGASPLVWANFIDHTEQRHLQEQLFQIQKLDSLGQLAGGVAHEFNNILAILMGHLNLLQLASPPGDPLAPRFEVMRRAAVRGSSIVKQLLLLARRHPLKNELLSVEALFRETSALVEGLFPENIRLTVEVLAGLPPLRGDRDQLGQAILNLVINARDAMPEGGTIVLAARAEQGEDATLVRLEVLDEGGGVAPELVDKIFDPFFSTKAEGKGTGLGLSLVATVAAAHRGKVGVEPRSPRGTTFFLQLPSATTEPLDHEPQSPARGLRTPLHTAVMLVENEPDILDFETEVLKGHGFQVTGCQSADDAWALLQVDPPAYAVVVTDLGLPGLGGEAFCNRLTTLQPRPVIVVQSGNLSPGAQERLTSLGVREFLLKPFTSLELIEAVERAAEPQERAP